MKLFIRLRRLKNMALLLGLAVFFLADVKADAAAAKKETPLTNLAEGKIPTLPNGQEVMNGQLVTDGDKYSDLLSPTVQKAIRQMRRKH